ncbi:MAG: aquaporin [Actinomycetota bacterium]
MEKSMPQRLTAEFVGTFALVFITVGVIASAGQIPGAGILAIALAPGLVIAAMVSSVGHVSGAHFNPAVTIGVWIAQKIKSLEAVAYIGAQLVGATAAALLLKVAIPKGPLIVQAAGGVPAVSTNGISNGQAVLIEAILTFFLVWVVFASAVDPEGSFSKVAGLAIGFTVVAGILMGATLTGGALNPARAFGPALVYGKWQGWWIYWVGPVAGGIVAAALYDGVILKRRAALVTDEGVEEIHGVGAHGEDEHVVE